VETAAYLDDCIGEGFGDAAYISKVLGGIARSQGMTQKARETRLSLESLYNPLSGERSPIFESILKLVSALGLTLSASVRSEAEVM